VLQGVAMCCSVLHCDAVCCNTGQNECAGKQICGVLQCVAVVWRYVAVCCKYGAVWCSVLQCGAVYCSVLQCVAVRGRTGILVLQCVAVCCSVLQCVAVCCSEMQCDTVCCNNGQNEYAMYILIHSNIFINIACT